jgi:coenzyme PQQ precursor peptide PqqA
VPGPDRQWRERAMKWKTPKVVEIACGMEINCYAPAKL